MNNYHQDSDILSLKKITKIERAFSLAWGPDTTDPTERNDWSVNNKALGQCAVTSIIIKDLFGGNIIYDKTNFHMWNLLPDGSQHDFSRSQFKNERIFSIHKYKTKKDILYNKRGIKTKMAERYRLLKKRFLENYMN